MKSARLLLLLGILILSGCVYYNGMYNARRLANKAEKAERDGRRFDAQNFWAQAEIKADSVIVRHPTSSWVDDALLIKSKALVIRGSCDEAVPHLERILFTSTDADLIEQANLILGECYAGMGDPEDVIRHVVAVSSGTHPERQRKAKALYGSALNRLGRHQEALQALSNLEDPALDGERAIALAGSGFVGAALDLADSLIVRRDTFVVWDSVLATIGRYDLPSASQLTDRLGAQDSILPDTRARYYLNDGRRWAAADPARAIERFALAARDSAARRNGGAARIEWARLMLRQVETTSQLAPILPVLQPATNSGGADALLARRMGESIQRVQSTADTLTAESPNGDIETFLLAETARDSLGAAKLARAFLRELTERWPLSPYSPKALLAMAALDPDNAEIYRQYLVYAYSDSPYLSYLAGQPTGDLRGLEDSLRAYAFSRVTRPQQNNQRRAGQGRQRRARADVDDLELENDPP